MFPRTLHQQEAATRAPITARTLTQEETLMQGLSRVWGSTSVRGVAAILLALSLALGAVTATLAQEREIKVGYMKNPIQDASLDMMEKWAKANNVKLTRIPMAYSVFMEKVTATLTSGADQFDMIWH